MNPAKDCINSGLEIIHFTTAFIYVSNYDHRSKHCDMTSLNAPQLKNLITILYKNCVDAVSIPIDAELLLGWRM